MICLQLVAVVLVHPIVIVKVLKTMVVETKVLVLDWIEENPDLDQAFLDVIPMQVVDLVEI